MNYILQSHKRAIKIYCMFYLESFKGSLLEFSGEILFFSQGITGRAWSH